MVTNSAASRFSSRLLTSLAIVLLLLLQACSRAEESGCPSKGWVPDRCAPYGEFIFNGKVLRIPNQEPNKYRWNGKLTYSANDKRLTSPNLAAYWKQNRPAGGDRWPESRPDLIRFSLEFSELHPQQSDVQDIVTRLQLVPRAGELPFSPPPGLALFVSGFERGLPGAADENVGLLFSSLARPTTLIQCPALKDHYANANTFCTGTFNPQPGLRVRYHLQAQSIKEWQEVEAYLKTLITSWETAHAK